MRKLLTAAAIASALLLGACQNPNGSVNWGNTLLMGAGAAGVAGMVALASQGNGYNDGYGRRGYGQNYGQNHGHNYGQNYSQGYGQGYGRRGW